MAFMADYGHAQVKKITAKKQVTSNAKKTEAIVGTEVVFKSGIDSASYALGQAVADDLKKNGISELNYELFSKGAKDAFTEAKTSLDKTAGRVAINNLFLASSKKKEAADKIKYASNIKAGEEFLAKNKTKPNINTTASGLQYEIITQGAGAKPKATDKVKVHYKGVLLDGTQFDSSYERGQPTSFELNQVIPGWTEGLQLMAEGSVFKLFIPYNLAYGARDMNQIKPYSTLIFEVELIKVNPSD